MSHPQPPDGPHDPYQPQPSDPWAPLPPAGPTAGSPQDGTWAAQPPADPAGGWAAPQPPGSPLFPNAAPASPAQPSAPVSGTPQPTSGTPSSPAAPYPPAGPHPPSGPYPPGTGYPAGPYPPGSAYPPAGANLPGGYPAGGSYPAGGAPAPGGAYPVGGAYPPGGGYPSGGGPYPSVAATPIPTSGSSGGKTTLIVVIVVLLVAMLCCIGGVIALVAGADRAADEVSDALPIPSITQLPPEPDNAPSMAAPTQPVEGETFNMRPGDTLILTDDNGTIEITVTTFRTVTEGCRSVAPKPKKGLYLIADVTAVVTKGTASINPFYFEWVADDGTTVNGLIGILAGCGNSLGSGNGLPSGTKRTGTVVFDVADTKGVLEYRRLFEPAGSWKP